jgi:5-methyltetrahydropteroyltriglutamate--homocysteine methyltransferase
MPAQPQPPFRAEVIGSLLRPRALKDAGRSMQEGRLSAAEYEALLEREIAHVVARQEDIGLQVVTDGELGRSSWFGFFFEGLDGFRLEPAHFKFKDAEGRFFEWPTCMAHARIRRRAPMLTAEFERANRHVRRAVVKATMPAPDLVAVYRAELAELGEAGCRYVQLDEVPIAMLCDPDVGRQAAAQGGNPAGLLDTYLGLLRRIVADRPPGMTVGMHLCRGNFRGRWMAAGGYEPVAEKLFTETPVDAFFLEYDTARAGDFQPLRFVPRGKRVVLGLVSSKSGEPEDQAVLLRRIDEAARVRPLDQLGLSTQCGFASVAGGNALTEDEQWAKLELVVDTAARVWGSA